MRIHFWYTIFSLFFIIEAVLAVLHLGSLGLLPTWISVFDFFLLTLAAFRLTRLFVYDTITAFIRGWFYGKQKTTFLGTLNTLINCPWCAGLWFGFIVSYFFFLTPYAWFFILFLAVGGLATSIQIGCNWLGWTAENAKQKSSSSGSHTCGG
ncbi:DUF1360 domain-containing protein [Candidatus Wolfebacteria bacterium]|nr:DUF1360 domain-containing protein [Candidatus Wolfebacteria bacterium]